MHKDTDFANPPGRRIGGLAIIRDESGAILMMKKAYKGGLFGLPGGCAHADEYPHVACAREVFEETELTIEPKQLLVVDCTPRNEADGAAEGINFVYDGGVVPSGVEITLPKPAPGEEPELIGYQFVPLYALHDFAAPYTQRRIRAAVAVLEDKHRSTAYLVEGQPVTADTQ